MKIQLSPSQLRLVVICTAFCFALLTGLGPASSLAQERPAEFGLNYHENSPPPYLGTLPANLTNPFLLPVTLSDTRAFAGLKTLKPSPGLVPYRVNAELWSDGAKKSRWMFIAGQAGFSADDEWTFPSGSVFVKHFDLVTNELTGAKRRLETRFLVRDNSAAGVYGVTYKWKDDESEALLLDAAGLDETFRITTATGVRTQVWHYPSRTQCLECHNAGAKGVLGVKTRQLNSELTYDDTGIRDNQLRALSALGLINTNLTGNPVLSPLDLFTALTSLDDPQASRMDKLRSYLDANCAHCHRAGGVNPALDARYPVAFTQQGIFNFLLSYRDAAGSRLLERVAAPNGGAVNPMPPLGRNLPHAEFINYLRDYIDNSFNVDYASVEGDGSLVTVHFNRPGAEASVDYANNYEIPGHTVVTATYFAQSRDAATFYVTPPITTPTYIQPGVVSDGRLPQDFSWNGRQIPLTPGRVLNDRFTNAFSLGSELFAYAPPITNVQATADTTDPRVNGSVATRTVWFKWTAPASRPMAVDTEGSSGPVLLGVYTGNAPGALMTIAADANPGPGLSRAQFNAVAGTTYFVMLGASAGSPNVRYHARVAAVNDQFANAVLVGTSGQVANWSARAFSRENGEPNHAGSGGGASAWFIYESPCACGISARTYESDFDTVLAVYTGTALNNLQLVIANDDVSAAETTSEVFFGARQGQRFYIAVDGKNGEKGNANLFFETYRGPSTQWVLPSAGEPVYAGVPARLRARFSGNFNAGAPVRYLVNGAVVGTDANVTNGVSWTPPAPGAYTLTVEGTDQSYGTAVDTRVVTALAATLRPPNDNIANAQPLSGPNVLVRGTNTNAGTQEGEPFHTGNRGGHSVWYRWTVPNITGSVYFRVSATDFDPLVAVYDDQVRLFSQNDDARAGTLQATTEFLAFPGVTYLIAVDGYNGGSGVFDFEIRYVNANDDFANAWVAPNNGLAAYVNNTGATAQGGEPSPYGSPQHTLWWTWTAPDDRPWSITTEGSEIPTVLAVYTGTALNNLARVPESHRFATGPDASRVVIFPTAGRRYLLAVDGYVGAEGNITLLIQPVGSPRIGNYFVMFNTPNPLAFFETFGHDGISGVLEATSDLRSWQPVWTNQFNGFGSYAPFSDYGITNPPARRFYRLRYAP